PRTGAGLAREAGAPGAEEERVALRARSSLTREGHDFRRKHGGGARRPLGERAIGLGGKGGVLHAEQLGAEGVVEELLLLPRVGDVRAREPGVLEGRGASGAGGHGEHGGDEMTREPSSENDFSEHARRWGKEYPEPNDFSLVSSVQRCGPRLRSATSTCSFRALRHEAPFGGSDEAHSIRRRSRPRRELSLPGS